MSQGDKAILDCKPGESEEWRERERERGEIQIVDPVNAATSFATWRGPPRPSCLLATHKNANHFTTRETNYVSIQQARASLIKSKCSLIGKKEGETGDATEGFLSYLGRFQMHWHHHASDFLECQSQFSQPKTLTGHKKVASLQND